MPPEVLALMAKLETMASIPVAEMNALTSLLKVRHLAKGDFFIQPHRPATEIGFLVSGLIRYYYVSSEGREFIKHFCFDGHFVSSYTALTQGTTSDYFIEALEPSRLVVFSFAEWSKLVGSHVVWGVINARVQAESLVLAERRERSLILDSATKRYLDLLEEIPGIEARVKQYDLANYLGITPVALSRIRGKPRSE